LAQVPEWLVWDGATGALLRLGTDGIDRTTPVAAIPEQYEVKSSLATGLMGDQGVLVPLGATGFVLGVRSTLGWSFSHIDETGAVTPLAIPGAWSDDLRLVAIRDRVVLVGRMIQDQTEEPALAIIDADGQVTTRIEPDWPIRDGAWVGSVEGESTLLVGGGLDANGPHGDLVAIGLPLLDITTILQDGAVDPTALGARASLFGVREEGVISVRAIRQGLAADRAPPVMELTAEGWRASGLAALDSPFPNASSVDRLQLGETCAPTGASWFTPPGKIEWGTSLAEPPLVCSAGTIGATVSTMVGFTTAFAVHGSSTWVANGGGLNRYQLFNGLVRNREHVSFGANAAALAASNHLLATAVGSTVSVHRETAAGWLQLGTIATCDAVHTLAFDGGTLWAAGATHLTRISVGRSSLGTSSSFVLGVDSVNNERLLVESSACTSPTVEPIERMAVAGHTLALGRAHSIQAYDLQHLPELAWVGTQPFTAPFLVEGLRTDGTRIYAKISHPAAGPSYPVFRLGPSQAFTPTGSATATAWVDGAEWSAAIAARRTYTSVEIRTR
jgi:hypothetical protein